MNRKRVFAVLFVLGLGAAASSVFGGSTDATSKTSAELKARGKYLVTTGVCNDCHTPKKATPEGIALDTTRLLSGHIAGKPLPKFEQAWLEPGQWVLGNEDFTAWVGPWGISYAVNLTPDDQTGIGLWTQDVFINAMRTGKHMGTGRPIQPPMPWQNIGMMTDDDLAAMFAYLKSLPPIKNQVPADVPMDQLKTSMH